MTEEKTPGAGGPKDLIPVAAGSELGRTDRTPPQIAKQARTLGADDVDRIRAEHAAGMATHAGLASRYGVTREHIRKVVRGVYHRDRPTLPASQLAFNFEVKND
jgi:hypothetical protein